MMEIDSYLKSVYDKTQNISSASFSSFFDDAIDVTNQFQEATNSMSEGIKSSWDDAVRIIFSGTASQITEQFDILNNSIQRLTPIGGYVDQFNDLMREYIQSVKQVNTLEAEKNSIRVPAPPTNTKDKESSGDQCLEHSEIFARETALHRIRVLEERIKKEEEMIESCKNACEGLINKISDILSYHPKFGSVPALSTDYDNVDYDTYEDDESQMFHYYVNYYKDGKLVRRDYETYDGDRSTRGTKYYYDNVTNYWGDPIEVVKEDHIEYSTGYELDGFTARANTKIENGVLKYDENGQIVSGTIGKYSYSKLPDENSDYWWNNVRDDVEIENYSFTMDPSVKTSNVSFYDYDNQYVLTTESYDSEKVVSDDGFVKITNGYNVERTSKNIRLSEHEDSVYEGKTEDGETTLEQVISNYNYKENSDGSTRATWDLKDGEEGRYIEYDSEGHCKNNGFARKETDSNIVENYRVEYNDNEKVVTIGSSTGKDTRSLAVEKDVKLVYSDDGRLSRKVGSVDLLTKDGRVGKTLEGITETYEKKKGMNVMTERTIDHVYHSDGSVENNVHDYLVSEAGNTTIIKSSAVESIVSSDGTIIATDVKRDYSNDNYYHEGTGTYGYENNGEQEGYVYCYGSLSSDSEPTVYYDNVRHYYYDDYGNLID